MDIVSERIFVIRGRATYIAAIPLAAVGIFIVFRALKPIPFSTIDVFLLPIVLWVVYWAIREQLQSRRIIEIDRANNTVMIKTPSLWRHTNVVTHRLTDFTAVKSYFGGGRGYLRNVVALVTCDNRALVLLVEDSEVEEKHFWSIPRFSESPRARSLRIELSKYSRLNDEGFHPKIIWLSNIQKKGNAFDKPVG